MYTVTELINRAWFLSGIVSRNFETPTGQQLSDGLYLLNALLDFKSADQRLIPYFTEYSGTLVENQEKYFIPNLIQWETFTFNNQSVRYATVEQTRKQYFGSPRVDNVSSLPFDFHFERKKGGSDLYVYFLPNSNYPYKIWGKFGLDQVELGEDLSLVYDLFYIEYLRYGLAEYMCAEYGIDFAPEKKKLLNSYEAKLIDISSYDLTTTKMSTLQKQNGLNWGTVNLGVGWTVM